MTTYYGSGIPLHKEVHVLASHSHFVMSDVYETSCRKPGRVLSGWIVGTAGAVRYRLPVRHSAFAETDVYGYLLGNVSSEGHITFSYKGVTEGEIPQNTVARYGSALVHECFVGNKSPYVPKGPICPVEAAPMR